MDNPQSDELHHSVCNWVVERLCFDIELHQVFDDLNQVNVEMEVEENHRTEFKVLVPLAWSRLSLLQVHLVPHFRGGPC